MKKFISSLLIFVFILSVGACSNNSVPEPEEEFTEENIIQTEITTTTKPVTQTTTEATTKPEIQLSSQCTEILCTGYDGEDYYELVANRVDAFPESTFQFGAIKNNKWLVPLSEKCPFIETDGRWVGLKSYEENNISVEDFVYLDEGCFLYKNSIVYKPETGIYFNVIGTHQRYTDLFGTFYPELVVNDDLLLSVDENYELTIFNMRNGSKKVICGYFGDDVREPNYLYGVHEGLFFALHITDVHDLLYVGFFDSNGKMVVDLSEYNVVDLYRSPFYYKNGETTIKCLNDSGVEFYITFDTSGNIIKQEKVE